MEPVGAGGRAACEAAPPASRVLRIAARRPSAALLVAEDPGIDVTEMEAGELLEEVMDRHEAGHWDRTGIGGTARWAWACPHAHQLPLYIQPLQSPARAMLQYGTHILDSCGYRQMIRLSRRDAALSVTALSPRGGSSFVASTFWPARPHDQQELVLLVDVTRSRTCSNPRLAIGSAVQDLKRHQKLSA